MRRIDYWRGWNYCFNIDDSWTPGSFLQKISGKPDAAEVHKTDGESNASEATAESQKSTSTSPSLAVYSTVQSRMSRQYKWQSSSSTLTSPLLDVQRSSAVSAQPKCNLATKWGTVGHELLCTK
jgi:hypothetical protein